MGFTVEIKSIKEKSNVIIPISMDNVTEKSGYLQAGDRLQLLIKELKSKQCKITVLVADTLQKHNVGEEAAKKMGDDFIANNKAVAEDKEVTVYRWQQFLDNRKEKYQKARTLIDENSKKDSAFYNKMLKTAQYCASKKDIESSIELQREEYAAILAMDDFDYLLYPRSITDGMAFLYTNTFGNCKKPQYEVPHYIKQTETTAVSFFSNSQKKKTSLPLVLRILLEQLETVLKSSEVSEEAKVQFTAKVENMITVWSSSAQKPTNNNSTYSGNTITFSS